jgi:hypothetical protein
MTRIDIHIDRVVLKGYASSDRHAIADGLREELARHYSAPEALGELRTGSPLEHVDAGRVSIVHGATPRAVGGQAARGIAKGLAR